MNAAHVFVHPWLGELEPVGVGRDKVARAKPRIWLLAKRCSRQGQRGSGGMDGRIGSGCKGGDAMEVLYSVHVHRLAACPVQ